MSTWARAFKPIKSELKETLNASQLRAFHQKDPSLHFAATFRQFLLLGVSSWMLAQGGPPGVLLLFACISGVTIFNFTVLLHEELHGLIFPKPKPRLSAILGYLYAFLGGLSRSQFTRWHLDHHAELGSPINDPKRHHLSPKKNQRWIKFLYFTPALFFIYFKAAAKETRTYPPALRKKIQKERSLLVGGHLLLQLVLWLFLSWRGWFWVYALPVYIVFPIAFALNRLGQHYCVKEDDPLGWTTWMKGNFFWDCIYLNANYHLEHHIFPGVPYYHLPQLQKLLKPLYHRHHLAPFTYGRLLKGWFIHNFQPHTQWLFP